MMFRTLGGLAALVTLSLASTPAAAQFKTGPVYAGPRVWLGHLNGAVAIGAQAEKGLTKAGDVGGGIIAGGVGVDFYSWSSDFTGGSYKYSVVPLQVFGNYHFVIKSNPKIDPYLGLALVYSVVSASATGGGTTVGASGSSADFAGQGGLRYFVSEKFAVQGQVGFGYGTLGLGASWQF